MDEQTTGFSHSSATDGIGNDAKKRKRSILISILVVIIAVAALWIGKQIQINNLRNESAKTQERLKGEAKQAVIQSHEQHLRIFAKPFAWAVRTEMMSNNINQVNLYMNEMIKEKNISSIMVLNAAGKIISSTNKKWEGKDFSAVGNASYLQSDSIIVDNIKDSLLIMSSPVMGFNNRLGTLIVNYSLSTPRLAGTKK